VARSTIATMLKQQGIPPSDERPTSWRSFLRAHWGALVAADFFTTEVWTVRGLVTYYTLFVIELHSRRVHLVASTPHPDEAFMLQIARHLGVVAFAPSVCPLPDAKARLTRRLRQVIGLDCQSMPTSHAAVRHGVSWGKARRAEHAFLLEWDRGRPKRRPRHLGPEEIHRGKAQKFYTVLSDLVRGEVMGLVKDRTEDSLVGLLTTCLDPCQLAVEAAHTDMHRPCLNAVPRVLPKAEIVFDKFHVLQHASAALDDVRRHEFFRAASTTKRSSPGG
jgi:transposase